MKLLILDGNSVINRAYFGVKPLTTRDGLYTHAIYGFLNILERMEKEEQPEAVCVAFDLHGPTFRHLKYEGYKATRHAMPEELAQQMPIMKDVLRALRHGRQCACVLRRGSARAAVPAARAAGTVGHFPHGEDRGGGKTAQRSWQDERTCAACGCPLSGGGAGKRYSGKSFLRKGIRAACPAERRTCTQ